jgi:NADPH:quinone reductase-like Zn-dependent oxidoreductase
VIGPIARTLKAVVLSPFVSQTLATFTFKPNGENLAVLKQPIEAGKVSPVTDRTYSLASVPEAVGYLEEGHARGKVVVTV